MFNNCLNSGKESNWRGAHGCAALVAVRANLRQKLLAVLDLLEELIEALRVALARVALEGANKRVCQQARSPEFVGEHRLGNSNAHLRIVGIMAGDNAMAWMFHIALKGVELANEVAIDILKSSPIGIADGKLQQHERYLLLRVGRPRRAGCCSAGRGRACIILAIVAASRRSSFTRSGPCEPERELRRLLPDPYLASRAAPRATVA